MRRACVPLGVAAGLAIGACFVKPDPPNNTRDGGGSGSDALTTDDAKPDTLMLDAPVCTVIDEFGSNGPGCGNAGNAEGSGSQTIERANGQLRMDAPTSSGVFSACQSPYVPWEQVVVQIVQSASTLGSRTGITVSFDGTETFTVELNTAGLMSARLNNASAEDFMVAGGGLYYRFRKNGSQLLFDYSSDNAAWSTSKVFQLNAQPSTAAVRLYTFYGNGGSAAFDHLNACSP